MAISQLFRLLLVVTSVSVTAGRDRYLEGPYQYTECVYNSYKAVCLGTDIRKRTCINCMRRQFPVLTNNENCVLLEGNLIEKFPDDLNSIKQIRTLDLSNNKIEALPDNLDVLEELQILDLSKNRLRTLSPRTRFPHLLRGLLLAGNQMETIPAGIEIPGLFVIDLSANSFTEIPFHFCVSNQLIRVDFTQNALQNEISYYLDTLNRCRNVNNVPFCLFTDRKDFKCECPNLYPVFFENPSFCMGTQTRNREMECDARSSADQFKDMSLFDIDRRLDFVQDNCSFTLQLGGSGDDIRASIKVTVFFISILYVILY